MQTVSKEEIKEKCLKIFNSYSKFNQNDKKYYLNQQNLIKLLKELYVLDNNRLKMSDIDIILKKVNTFDTKIHFKQFMDVLVHITKKLDPEGFKSNQKDTIRELILEMWSLFNKNLENFDNISYNQEDSVISLNQSKNLHSVIENFVKKYEIDNKIIAMINDIYHTIKEIYTVYFVLEVGGMKEKTKIIANSFQGLSEFVKDFEIVPYLCNNNNLIVYWEYLLSVSTKELTKNKLKSDIIDERKDIGREFTLSKFSALLVYLGVFSFNKCNPLSVNTVSDPGIKYFHLEKLLLFFERLENSKGFKNLQLKTFKPHSAKITFIPSKDIIISVRNLLC